MTFRRKLNSRYHVLADFEEWKKGRWIHYSSSPFLKMNLDPRHLDTVGIYLFPEKFKTKGSWHAYPYKFYVEFPDNLKVLDLAKMSKDDCRNLMQRMGVDITKAYDADRFEKAQFPAYVDMWWEATKNVFMSKRGAWNKAFRDAGYEAIFDDTNSIFNGETQLIILDPRKFKVVERVDPKGTGFDVVNEITGIIVSQCEKYGKVKKTPPKKKWEGWDRRNIVMSYTQVENQEYKLGEDNSSYRSVSFEVTATPDSDFYKRKFKDFKEFQKAHIPARKYQVSIKSSYPHLEQDWHVKKYIEFEARDYSEQTKKEIQELVERALKVVFEEEPGQLVYVMEDENKKPLVKSVDLNEFDHEAQQLYKQDPEALKVGYIDLKQYYDNVTDEERRKHQDEGFSMKQYKAKKVWQGKKNILFLPIERK